MTRRRDNWIVVMAAIVLYLTECPTAYSRMTPWSEHYIRGIAAVRQQQWQDAVTELNQAIAGRETSDLAVTIHMNQSIEYLPYLLLGEAFLGMGEADLALDALILEERQGKVRGSDAALVRLNAVRDSAIAMREAARPIVEPVVQAGVARTVLEAERLQSEGRTRETLVTLVHASVLDPNNQDVVDRIITIDRVVVNENIEANFRRRRAEALLRTPALIGGGKAAEAARILAEVIGVNPDPQVEQLLGEAGEVLTHGALSGSGDDAVASRVAIARYLRAKDDLAEALAVISACVEVAPNDHVARALRRELRGEIAEQTERRPVASREPNPPTATRNGAGASDVTDAFLVVARALAATPDDPVARTALLAMSAAARQDLLNRAPELARPASFEIFGARPEPAGRPVNWDVVTSRRDYRLEGMVYVPFPPARVAVSWRGPDASSRPMIGAVSLSDKGSPHFIRVDVPVRLTGEDSVLSIDLTDRHDRTVSQLIAVHFESPLWRRRRVHLLVAGGLSAVGACVYLIRGLRRRMSRVLDGNPYIAGAPVSERHFIGREKLLSRIMQTIRCNSLLLHGERRIGKTSIQHQLKRRLRAERDPRVEYHPVYIDLEGVHQDRLFWTLATEITTELGLPRDGHGPFELERGPQEFDYECFARGLASLFATLQKNCGGRTAKLILLLDEVDELNAYEPWVNQRLRSVFQRTSVDNLVAVLAGVRVNRRWAAETSPWYNFFEELQITTLDRTDATTLIRGPSKGSYEFADDAVEEILGRTGCRPYDIQRLCMALVNHAREQGRRRITMEHVAEAVRNQGAMWPQAM